MSCLVRGAEDQEQGQCLPVGDAYPRHCSDSDLFRLPSLDSYSGPLDQIAVGCHHHLPIAGFRDGFAP
jgi:hypothetical protein